jgi:hypothetical protein
VPGGPLIRRAEGDTQSATAPVRCNQDGRENYSFAPALFQSMMLTRFQWFFLS